MNLLNFLNTTSNWCEVIAAAPYNIEVKQYENFFILSYDMIATDWSAAEWLKECRGSIVTQNASGEWVFACRPFDKFFNWNEPYAAVIDWRTATVRQKIDGSLIKLWNWEGIWHMSTNGLIAPEVDKDANRFYSAYRRLFPQEALTSMDPAYTYMFEYIGPDNRIVLYYDCSEFCYLGRRNNQTGIEDTNLNIMPWFRKPVEFDLNKYFGFKDFTNYVACLNGEEGYVVTDANFNRVKVKTDEYFELHHLRMNCEYTPRQFLKLYECSKLDDFISAFPEYSLKTSEYFDQLHQAAAAYEDAWEASIPSLDNKTYALSIAKCPHKAYLFARRCGKVTNFYDWFKTQSLEKREKIMEGRN